MGYGSESLALEVRLAFGDLNDPDKGVIQLVTAVRKEVERLRAKLEAIEQDGTAEHNAAVALRAEVARLRAEVDRYQQAIADNPGAVWWRKRAEAAEAELSKLGGYHP